MKEIQINTYNQHAITAQIYESAEAKALLIIASAVGVKQSYYRDFSRYIADHQITVITFDYFGIGKSMPADLPEISTDMLSWGQVDLDAVIDYAYKRYPVERYMLLGHSVGGQLVGLAPYARQLSKIITVGSQSGYWRFWKKKQQLRMWINWKLLIPLLTRIYGYLPSKRLTGMENLPKQVALQWSRWCLSSNYLFDHLEQRDLYFQELAIPLVALSIDDDTYAPKAAVDWISSQFTAAELQRIHLLPADFKVNKIGHFGIFKESFKDSIWPQLLKQLL